MACTLGERYTPTDLQTLTGASKSALQRLVCDLAIGFLYSRRPNVFGPPPKQFEMAIKTLDQLNAGRLVFGLVENQAAGKLSDRIERAAGVESRGMITTEMERFFGRRNNRLHG